jgi:hypothetical protein
MNDDILLAVHDRIATLTFNRPASLNSLSLASIQSLLQHLRDLWRMWATPCCASRSVRIRSSSICLTFANYIHIAPGADQIDVTEVRMQSPLCTAETLWPYWEKSLLQLKHHHSRWAPNRGL